LLRRSCTSGIATDRCASLLARWKDSTPCFMTEGMFAIGMMQRNSLIFITNGAFENEESSPLAPPRRVLIGDVARPYYAGRLHRLIRVAEDAGS